MTSRLVLNSLKTLNKTSIIQSLTRAPQLNAAVHLSATRSFSCTPRAFQAPPPNVFTDLKNFLNEEIKLEKESSKHKALPKITGFEVKTEGPNVTLTKTHNGEQVTVKFNVNGSLNNMDQEQESAKPEETEAEMKARPVFTVDIKKGSQILSFSCDFLPAEEAGAEASKEAPAEDFQINELAIHSGEWNENVYTADCSVLDGQLYDLLLNLLDERGIGEKFANEVAEFSTAYEHSQYVGLLDALKTFSA